MSLGILARMVAHLQARGLLHAPCRGLAQGWLAVGGGGGEVVM